jgi:hypothetical protein
MCINSLKLRGRHGGPSLFILYGTRIPEKELDPKELRQFFISHLNRIYCAKSRLVEKLPELGKRSHYVEFAAGDSGDG